ncbi:MAG: TRAP transporter substrate-binding protein [Rhodospirillaceae bacterium]|nr:TRAP transporter substrate-binding protein [Rhodospirillaceae bacterium]
MISWRKSLTTAVAVAAVAVVGATSLAGSAAAQDERIRWRVPGAFPTSLPALGDNLVWVADQLNAASGGAIEFRVAEPGELVPALELTEAIGSGQIDAGYNWIGYDQGRIPSSPLFAAVPFGMEPWEYSAWWYYGGGRELAEDIYGAQGVHPIFCGITGPETAGWFREPINSLEDFQGLRIRFAGLGGRVLQALGANVTMLPGGELFQALERNVIDATEFSLPIVDQRLGFDRVATYNYFPGWHQPFAAFHLEVNNDVWAGLSDQQRAMLDTGCMAGVLRNLSYGEAIQGEVIQGFIAGGVTATRLNEDILRELYAVSQEVLAEEAANDADFARVYESQEEFRRNYAYWRTLAYLPRDFYGDPTAQTEQGAEQ